ARETGASEDWWALRVGRSAADMAALEGHGHIRLADNRAAARDHAVDIWDRERRRGHSVLLLTDSSNIEVDALNRAAQDRRLRAGEIGGQSIEVVAPHRNRLTERRESIFAGDEVVLQRTVADS